jgi:hypothetical protein
MVKSIIKKTDLIATLGKTKYNTNEIDSMLYLWDWQNYEIIITKRLMGTKVFSHSATG